MEIRLVRTVYPYAHDHCATCGDRLEPDEVRPFAYDQRGTQVGFLCERCSVAGHEELRSRIRHQAAALRQRAIELDRLAAEDAHLSYPPSSRGVNPWYDPSVLEGAEGVYATT